MTHSHFLKKAAQKLQNLSFSRNSEQYIKVLESVRDSCSATIDKYYNSRIVKHEENTDDVVMKDGD